RKDVDFSDEFTLKQRKVLGNENTCKLAPDSGYWCTGLFGTVPPQELRFYFDTETSECKCFYYNGCSGNANNFFTEKQCVEYCQTKTSKIINRNTLNCMYFP
ncbi:serine proteinase inhibitor-like protein, partial [Dinothrombium tinctorium]